MKISPAPLAATFSVLAFLAWLAVVLPAGRGGPAPPPPPAGSEAGAPTSGASGTAGAPGGSGVGSRVPCRTPLPWRIAGVDPEFELGPDAARRVVEEAAALWEAAVGEPLFLEDPEEGFPVRLVYDGRQARTRERRRGEEALEEERRELEERVAELSQRMEAHQRDRERYRRRAAELRAEMDRHNEAVRSWNRRDETPPPAVLVRMEGTAASLDARRQDLGERARALDELGRELRLEGARTDRRVRNLEERARALEAEFPPVAVEAGVYREAVRTEAGAASEIGREIRIYRFRDLDELRIVTAHELGHALGLGHAPEAASLMSEAQGRGEPGAPPPRILPADVERLRSLCAGR